VAGDVELRAELRRRGQRRLGRYEPGPIGERLRAAVEATLAA
jgi:hypothetical protein